MNGEPVYDMPDTSVMLPKCPRCRKPTIDGNCTPCDAKDIVEARRAQREIDRFGSGPAGLRRYAAHLKRQGRG